MKGLLILALAVPNSTTEVEECPAELVLKIPKLGQKEAGIVNRYAQCMSIPYAPLAPNFSAKKEECGGKVVGKNNQRTALAFGWVDKMAVNLTGCETNLKIKRK